MGGSRNTDDQYSDLRAQQPETDIEPRKLHCKFRCREAAQEGGERKRAGALSGALIISGVPAGSKQKGRAIQQWNLSGFHVFPHSQSAKIGVVISAASAAFGQLLDLLRVSAAEYHIIGEECRF